MTSLPHTAMSAAAAARTHGRGRVRRNRDLSPCVLARLEDGQVIGRVLVEPVDGPYGMITDSACARDHVVEILARVRPVPLRDHDVALGRPAVSAGPPPVTCPWLFDR